MIDKANVGGLRKLLGTHTESGTVRAAVQHRLASLQTRESPGSGVAVPSCTNRAG